MIFLKINIYIPHGIPSVPLSDGQKEKKELK
jgi:hypothetical protein